MLPRMKKAILCLLLWSLAATGHAASFDCKKAATRIEKQICADALLSKLDSALADNYLGMLEEADFGGAQENRRIRAAIKAEQRAWLARRNTCKDRSCLIEAYRVRINETCDYGVVQGAHPVCVMADSVIEEGAK